MRKIFLTILILLALSQISFATADSSKWIDISGDLPNLHINSIVPHPFYSDSLFIGTNAGAFQTSDGGKHWNKIKFDEKPDVRITQIRAEMHPILDWTVPILWLGTEEFSDIPEDRLGRIFFSEDGGSKWINTYFPRIAVLALDVPKDSSLVAFAAAFNPFYYLDSFFAMDDTGWVEYDLTPEDTTVVCINCIEVNEKNPNQWFLATSNGLYATKDWGINWTNSGSHYNSPWAVISQHQPEILYAILFGGTRSEGIYRSKDAGQNWERVCWTVNAVNFLPDYSNPGVWYKAIKNLGVYKSTDDCSTWTDISKGLSEKDILCLVQDRRNPNVLYAGTTNGIFRYEEEMTSVQFFDKKLRQNKPGNYNFPEAYPNPFNAIIQIHYQVNVEMTIVNIQIFNILGKRIIVLMDTAQPKGEYFISWDGRDKYGTEMSSGVYFCRIKFNNSMEQTLKLVLIR